LIFSWKQWKIGARSQQYACAQCQPHRMLHQIYATIWIVRVFHHLRRKFVWSTGSAGGKPVRSPEFSSRTWRVPRNCSGNLPSDSAVTWKLVLEWWNLQAASTNQFLGPTIAVAKYHTRHWATMSNLYFVQLDRRRAGARKATIPNAPKASTSLLRRPDWAHVFELVQSVHKSYHIPSPKLSAYQLSVTICKTDCAVPCYCHWTKDIR